MPKQQTTKVRVAPPPVTDATIPEQDRQTWPAGGVAPLPEEVAPVPGFVALMQAMLVDSIRPGDWIYEIKFDGYRALALRGGNETRILSRNEKDLGGKFPEIKTRSPPSMFRMPSLTAKLSR
jgi:hypothetical protein